MWKRFYSNSGLILLAILAAGIWFSNVMSFFPVKSTPEYANFDAAPVVSPTSVDRVGEFLKRSPAPITIEEALKRPVVASRGPRLSVVETCEQERARRAPTPAPKLSALEIFERYQRERDETLRQSKVNTGATAICKDGFYSFSATRRGTCSDHGGVKVWLRR